MKRRFRFGRCVLLAGCVGLVRADSGPGWPMRGGDAANSGVSSTCGAKKGVAAWSSPGSHPVVGPDGTVYTCVWWAYEDRGELWALDPRDGSKKWTVRLTASDGFYLESSSPPLVGPDGHIYVGWAFGYRNPPENDVMALLAFDNTGQLLWRFEPQYNGQTTGGAQPIWRPNDTVIIPISVTAPNTERASLLAIDSRTGQLRWRFANPRLDAPQLSPAIGNGRLYYQTRGFVDLPSLSCLNPETGELIWEVYPIYGGFNLPMVAADGTGEEFVYASGILSYDSLTKLDSSGAVVWDYYPGPSRVQGTPAAFGDRVYVPAGAGPLDPPSDGLHVLDAETGQLLTVLGPRKRARSVALDRKGNIFVQAVNSMFAYSPGGDFLWEAFFLNSSYTTVAIGRDGLIVGSNGIYTFAYKSVLARGDMDCDGTINQFDVQPFITALADPQTYEGQYQFCSLDDPADVNNDGSVNLFDIQPFVKLMNP